MNSWAFLPNVVTVWRALLGLIGAICLMFAPEAESEARAVWLSMVAGVFLVIAALGDALDGWLARALNAQTRFGALIDPIADKIIVAAYLIAFMRVSGFDPWLVAPAAVIIARDLAVTGIRLSRLDQDSTPLPVSAAAKWKTALELIVLAAPFAAVAIIYLGGFSPQLVEDGYYVWVGGVWFAALLSGATFIGYLRRRG